MDFILFFMKKLIKVYIIMKFHFIRTFILRRKLDKTFKIKNFIIKKFKKINFFNLLEKN